MSQTSFTGWVLLGIVCLACASEPDSPSTTSGRIFLDRARFRITYVKDDERLQRASAAVEGKELSSREAILSIFANPTDTLVAQVSFVDEQNEPVFPQQAFLRFAYTNQPEIDTVYVLGERGTEMRKEFGLRNEIKADTEFWRPDLTYTIELIVGDVRMKRGAVWLVTKNFTFDQTDVQLFEQPSRSVFDFDISVKKNLLPEFETPLPASEKQAAMWKIVLFTVLSLAPFILLMNLWANLGAFPLRLPETKKEQGSLLLFEFCLLSQVGALTMFWLQWNIVVTAQVIAALMIPTLFFGHQVLSAKATSEAMAEKDRQKRK